MCSIYFLKVMPIPLLTQMAMAIRYAASLASKATFLRALLLGFKIDAKSIGVYQLKCPPDFFNHCEEGHKFDLCHIFT